MRDDVVGDSGLWSRGVDGNGSAFGELFDIHHDRVFRHAYRLVENRHDAEDVTATAFLELWRRRADVRLVDGSVLPWLLGDCPEFS
jgi:RNA polymerase sigma-70 factor (ECF subfamily)